MLAVTALLGTFALAPAGARANFALGLEDVAHFQGPTAATAFGAVRTVNASTVRLGVPWSSVAPRGAEMPSGFDPGNPGDPRYDWASVDATVRAAAQRRVDVLMMLFRAPAWAEGPHRPADSTVLAGAWDPSPSQFQAFAHAAAVRYSGHFPDPLHPGAYLPRVKDWEIWNEPNLPWYLAAPNLVDEYRALLNAGYSAIKAVNPGDVVVTGGLAPVSFLPPRSVSPLVFAADLFCLRRVGTAFIRGGPCPVRARFDVFSHHPYSLAATPTKPAYNYDDVLVADMGKLSRLLRAAERLHTVAPAIRHRLWVTEWAWFTDPPNHVVGDSPGTAARYVAYAMYEMWRAGAQLVIWQIIEDTPAAATPGGGLYTRSGRPKLMLSAFAFPLVAGVSRGRGFAWGRAPVSRRMPIVVQRAAGRSWKTVAKALTASDGVFYVRFRARGNGRYRAHIVHGATSLAYDSTPIPPRRTHLFNSG